MSKYIYFEFHCKSCGHEFEDLVQPAQSTTWCPKCGWAATKVVSAPRLDPRMGLDSAFSTMSDRWGKIREERARKGDKGGRADGAPNLKMY